MMMMLSVWSDGHDISHVTFRQSVNMIDQHLTLALPSIYIQCTKLGL